jgi:putative transposase
MKASKFSDAQKAFILKHGNDGSRLRRSAARPGSARRPISIGRGSMTGCCRRRCGGLKQLEDENAKLRKVVADLSLDKEMLQDVIRRKL